MAKVPFVPVARPLSAPLHFVWLKPRSLELQKVVTSGTETCRAPRWTDPRLLAYRTAALDGGSADRPRPDPYGADGHRHLGRLPRHRGLLTAELVANAVEHTVGDGPIELVVEVLETGWQVEVHDRDPAPPGDLSRPGPGGEPDPWQEHGRGLLLIRTLSSSCGHRTTEHGKAVWFTLPSHQPQSQGVSGG